VRAAIAAGRRDEIVGIVDIDPAGDVINIDKWQASGGRAWHGCSPAHVSPKITSSGLAAHYNAAR